MFEDGQVDDAAPDAEPAPVPDFQALLAHLDRCFYSFAAFGEGPAANDRSSA